MDRKQRVTVRCDRAMEWSGNRIAKTKGLYVLKKVRLSVPCGAVWCRGIVLVWVCVGTWKGRGREDGSKLTYVDLDFRQGRLMDGGSRT